MFATFPDIVLAGASAAVPEDSQRVSDLMKSAGKDEAFTLKRVAMLAGLDKRHVASEEIFAGDLGIAACASLLEYIDWKPDSISALYFATLTPDFITPSVSTLIAGQLGFSSDCLTTDIMDGCPGLIHAALLACGLLGPDNPRAIILAGSVYSKAIRKGDTGNCILFGDAVGAIALEYDPANPESGISFYQKAVPDSTFAIAHHCTGFRMMPGKERGLYMKGGKVADFCSKHVEVCMRAHLELAGKNTNEIEGFFLHQPNKMIVDRIVKTMGLNKEKVPSILKDFANCSGACLPLLACAHPESKGMALFCAFGTGLKVCSMLAYWDCRKAATLAFVKAPKLDLSGVDS